MTYIISRHDVYNILRYILDEDDTALQFPVDIIRTLTDVSAGHRVDPLTDFPLRAIVVLSQQLNTKTQAKLNIKLQWNLNKNAVKHSKIYNYKISEGRPGLHTDKLDKWWT